MIITNISQQKNSKRVTQTALDESPPLLSASFLQKEFQ
jgi:hypothetical protein